MSAPTVPERAPRDMPEVPRCTACGQIPDTSRVTCIPCLTGRAFLTNGNPTTVVLTEGA